MAKFHLENDTKERLSLLVRERLPWLILGLCGGIIATVLVSSFEETLSKNIALAFFLPVIIYMSDAIGTQTENVYVRRLANFKDSFWPCTAKEILIGLTFGMIFGFLLGLFAKLWLHSDTVAFTIGISMLINGTIAPVVALVVPEIIFKRHNDPALGAGPFTTVLQNILSISVYFLVAAIIIF